MNPYHSQMNKLIVFCFRKFSNIPLNAIPIEPMLLEWTNVQICLVVSFVVWAFEGMQT